MPKLFPVLIEIEQSQVGKVMLALNKMPGVAKIGLEMDRRKPKPNGDASAQRGPYKTRAMFEKTGDEVITEAIYAMPNRKAVTTNQLRELFVSQGRSAKSIHSQLHKLKSEGNIKNTADGWILTKIARDRIRGRERYQKKK